MNACQVWVWAQSKAPIAQYWLVPRIVPTMKALLTSHPRPNKKVWFKWDSKFKGVIDIIWKGKFGTSVNVWYRWDSCIEEARIR